MTHVPGINRLFCALRRSRASVILLALAALLFAQTALAFYRCPQLTSSAAAVEQMPCEDMDPASPALCKAFVQGDAQGLDGKRLAIDFAAVAPLLSALPLWIELPPPRARVSARSAPLRTRAPPLWITFGRYRD
jgi:hypothetical protein